MQTRLLAFTLTLLALPSAANAQVIYEAPTPQVQVQVTPPQVEMTPPPQVPIAPPPRVVVAPPPVYVAPPRYYAPPPRYYAPPPPPRMIYVPPPPHVYIRERIRWHLRRAGVPVPPSVYVQVAPAPQPPAYYPPPPPAYYPPPQAPLPPIPPPLVAPPPMAPCPPQPCCAEAAPAPQPEALVLQKATPPVGWQSRFGLGVRGTGQVINSDWNNLGIGGEILYRAASHVSLELAAEYQKNTSGSTDRMDIPATFGVRLHIGKPSWILSPYFVFALGFDYAVQDLRVTQDEAVYFDGQLGGGLELRLGQHVAITADARFDGKKRLDDPSEKVLATSSVDGKRVHALGDEYGAQFRLGFAVYF